MSESSVREWNGQKVRRFNLRVPLTDAEMDALTELANKRGVGKCSILADLVVWLLRQDGSYPGQDMEDAECL